MTVEKAVPQGLVLDLTSFQLIRAGQRIKLEKTPMELLALLVRHRGALVTREEIVRTIWGDAVHIDVDAGINTAIRKIRQALDDDPSSPRYLETVVGKGYRFIGPIDLVDVRNNDAPNNDPFAAQTTVLPTLSGRGAKLALVAGCIAAVLLVAVLAMFRRPSADHQGRQMIAVVPLQNLSENPGQDYFVDGLTDEILTQLGQLNPAQLGVVRYRPSTAVQQAKSSISDFARRSGLQYLLEGSVRRHQDQARISVRLVRVSDDTALWTDSFDRHVGDVLTLQSEIAQRIAGELQIEVLGRANRKPASPEVGEAYLRGRFELTRYGNRDAARVYFERAIALDPLYAPAHAGLADFYRSRAIANDEGAEQAWRLAELYATQALSLDGESAEAHTATAQIKLMHDWDWHAAREHALRALQLNPSSPEAHAVYARYLRTAGHIEDALNQRQQALALDPFREDLKAELTMERYLAHDFKNLVSSARQALASDPDNQVAHEELCFNLPHLGLFDEAVTECSKELGLEGHSEWVNAYQQEYRKRGYGAANSFIARKQLQQTLKRAQPDLWDLANAYVLAGMRDEAFDTLFRGLQTHEPGLLQIRVDPDFDIIRDDPRYAELISKIGFPTE